MSYPRSFLLVTWGGVLAETEAWSTRLLIASTLPLADLDLISFAATSPDDFYATLTDTVTYGGAYWSGLASLDYCKVAPVGADGHYLGTEAPGLFTVPDGSAALGGQGHVPPQIATAVTLRTASSRGAAARGRSFWPAGAVDSIGSDGLMAASAAQTMATSAAGWLGRVNDVATAGLGSNAGVVVGSKKGAGVFHAVTSVAVGRALDTQRRRRKSLLETYGADVSVPS